MTKVRLNYPGKLTSGLIALWSLTKESRASFLLLVFLGLVASFIETMSVSLVVFLLYRVAVGAEFSGAQGLLASFFSLVEKLAGGDVYRLVAAIGVAVLIRQAFVGAYEQVAARVTNAVHHRLRSQLFQQYLSVSYEHIAQKDYGELTNTLQVETWRVSQAVHQFSRILINLSAILIYLGVISLISWPVTLAVIFSGFVVTGITQIFRNQLRALSHEATMLHEQLAERMFTSIQSMRTIRVYGAEHDEISRFSMLSRKVERVFVRLAAIDNACRPLIELASIGAIVFMIWVSYSVGNSGTTTVAIVALLFRVQPQAKEMQSHFLSLLSSEASLLAVARAMNPIGKPYPPQGHRRLTTFERALAFRDVGFLHKESSQPALDSVSFVLECGTMTALVGSSGAGKTTIVNLLLKLYEPTTGVITVDNLNLSEVDRGDWLQRIAIAGQDIELIEGSIYDNVRMARPGAAAADIKAALSTAGVLDFVEQLPDGVQTHVGERGLRLSGGQRQRVGLARALLGKPDILILDEALNAVDSLQEASIHEAIRFALPKLTTLVVAHRSSALAGADRVILLENGQVSTLLPTDWPQNRDMAFCFRGIEAS